MKKLLGVIILSCFGLSATAQLNLQTDTIRWSYNTIRTIASQQTLDMSGNLISYGTSKFEWTQDGVTESYSISANSVTGEWQDLLIDGEQAYSVTCNGLDGFLTISRVSGQLSIKLDFGEAESLSPHVILNVSNFQKN